MGLENLSKVMCNTGVKTDELAESLNKLISKLPPLSEEDIQRVKANPSLSFLAKRRIIKNMRKQIASA